MNEYASRWIWLCQPGRLTVGPIRIDNWLSAIKKKIWTRPRHGPAAGFLRALVILNSNLILDRLPKLDSNLILDRAIKKNWLVAVGANAPRTQKIIYHPLKFWKVSKGGFGNNMFAPTHIFKIFIWCYTVNMIVLTLPLQVNTSTIFLLVDSDSLRGDMFYFSTNFYLDDTFPFCA